MSELVDDIEPCPEVNRQRLEYFPLVLEIEPVVGAGFFWLLMIVKGTSDV